MNARSEQAALFVFSFLEASFPPVPVEAVMPPCMEVRRGLVWRLATLALAGFMLSTLPRHAIGGLFFDQGGRAAGRLDGLAGRL